MERRTLAYESPLTPPVTDIASRIQQRRVSPPLQRDQEEQVAAETARANNSNGAPAGVLTDAAFSPQAAVATRTPADVPRHELYRGSVIAAVLESAIDSDLPGLVRARTTRDVYDSRTGTHVLIPRGSRLIGVYGQNNGGGPGAGANRRRLFVAWEELRLPDGTPVALDNFSALGADGASGIKARRATGFLEALGAAVVFDLAGNATAILTAATGIGRQQSETGALCQRHQWRTRQFNTEGGGRLCRQPAGPGAAFPRQGRQLHERHRRTGPHAAGRRRRYRSPNHDARPRVDLLNRGCRAMTVKQSFKLREKPLEDAFPARRPAVVPAGRPAVVPAGRPRR